MLTAEIITIGTEILLGEIVDTNASTIARTLGGIGVDLYRKTTVGDNVRRIAQVIQESLERAEIVITSGGLGPTIDDNTREAVASAIGVELEYQPELWDQIQERFRRYGRQPTENNKRQAYIPKGAIAVENQVGTAPAFITEINGRTVISLPGVPRELEYLLENAVVPYIKDRFAVEGVIKSRILHISGVGESQIDDLIGDLELLSNPTVGLAAHAGQVDVRITAKGDTFEQAEALILPVEATVRERLGNWIYGVDHDTLEGTALQNLADYDWKLGVVEAGLNGRLTRRLASAGGPFLGGEVLTEMPDSSQLKEVTREFRKSREVEVALGIALYPAEEKQEIHMALITPNGERTFFRTYGGPPLLAPTWAVNIGLDLIRKLENKGDNDIRD